MSKFVNYKKRAITLPAGCKDLIDLFRPRGLPNASAGISPNESPVVTRGESVTGKLSDIGKYVAMAFNSQATMFTLMVASPTDRRMTFDCGRATEQGMNASVVFLQDGELEQSLQSFFIRHGLDVPIESGKPHHFLPEIPVHHIFRILPLPSDATVLSELVSKLFREVGGFSDVSELSYHYYEFSDKI